MERSDWSEFSCDGATSTRGPGNPLGMTEFICPCTLWTGSSPPNSLPPRGGRGCDSKESTRLRVFAFRDPYATRSANSKARRLSRFDVQIDGKLGRTRRRKFYKEALAPSGPRRGMDLRWKCHEAFAEWLPSHSNGTTRDRRNTKKLLHAMGVGCGEVTAS